MIIFFRFDYISRDGKSRLLIMTLFIGGFLIPFILLIVFNILILLTLRAKNRSLITKFIKIGKFNETLY